MKKFLAIVLALVMVLSLVACGTKSATTETTTSTDTTETKKPNFALFVFDYSNTFMSYVRKGIENYCKDKANLDTYDAANDQTKQNDQISTVLQKGGVDVLLVNLVDGGAGEAVINLVKPYNLPIVFLNRAPLLEEGIMDTYENCWYVGIGWREPGLAQAQLVKDAWTADSAKMDKNGDGILQYILIQGNIAQQDAIHRTAAVEDSMAAWNKDGSLKNEQLDKQEAGWSTTKAKEIYDTLNVKYGDKVEAVICNNDAMAMGVIESLRSSGAFDQGGSFVYVYGINALPEAVELLQSGELSGTVMTSPWKQAVAIVDIACNVAAGKQPLDGTDLKFGDYRDVRVLDTAISLSNVQDAIDDYGKCS